MPHTRRLLYIIYIFIALFYFHLVHTLAYISIPVLARTLLFLLFGDGVGDSLRTKKGTRSFRLGFIAKLEAIFRWSFVNWALSANVPTKIQRMNCVCVCSLFTDEMSASSMWNASENRAPCIHNSYHKIFCCCLNSTKKSPHFHPAAQAPKLNALLKIRSLLCVLQRQRRRRQQCMSTISIPL